MITSFTVGGFKPFPPSRPARFELAPLTVLVGENGSGKTSLFEAIALLAQSAGSTGFQWGAPAASGGRNDLWVKAPPPGCFHQARAGSDLTFKIEIRISEEEHARALKSFEPSWKVPAFPLTLGTLISYDLAHSQMEGGHLYWKHVVRWGDLTARREYTPIAAQRGPDHGLRPFDVRNVLAVSVPIEKESPPPDENPGGNPASILGTDLFQSSCEAVGPWLPIVQAAADLIADHLRYRFSYLGAERGPVFAARRVDSKSGVPRSVGKHGQDTLRLLSTVFGKGENQKKAERIREWAAKFRMAQLTAGWHGGMELGCEFRDPVTGSVLSFDLSGFGSAQLLPVLVELFASAQGSTILIEEPEISLHPKAVSELPVMIAESVREGRQVIVSTHSEVLLSDLHRAVSEGGLPSSQMAVLHLDRRAEGVTVQNLPLCKEGLIEGWVPSFSKAEDESVGRWFDTVKPRL